MGWICEYTCGTTWTCGITWLFRVVYVCGITWLFRVVYVCGTTWLFRVVYICGTTSLLRVVYICGTTSLLRVVYICGAITSTVSRTGTCWVRWTFLWLRLRTGALLSLCLRRVGWADAATTKSATRKTCMILECLIGELDCDLMLDLKTSPH